MSGPSPDSSRTTVVLPGGRTRRVAGFPVGLSGSTPTATVDGRGAVSPTAVEGDTGVQFEWWVGDVESWHRPTRTIARQRLLRQAPIIESKVKVAGGDIVVQTGVAAPAGGGPAGVLSELENPTPAPVVAAVVAGPHEGATWDGEVLHVGDFTVVLDRAPAQLLHAGDRGALGELLGAPGDAEVEAPTPGTDLGAGWTALIVPVPHTRRLRWVLQREGSAGLERFPALEQVVDGWAAHREHRGFRRRGATDTDDERFDVALTQLELHPWSPDWSDARLGAHVGAALRVGAPLDVDAALGELTRRLPPTQRRARRLLRGDDDALASTLDLVDAVLSIWRAGVPAELLDSAAVGIAGALAVIGEAAAGDRWDLVLRSRAVGAQLLAALGHQAAAEEFAGALPRRPPGSASEVPTGVDALGAVIDADGRWDPVESSRSLISAVDGHLTSGSTIEVFGVWDPSAFGASIEIEGVPTAWGRAGVALRWHGDRAALLWELEDWDDGRDLGEPVWTAPLLDPAWRGYGSRGEALLGAYASDRGTT